MKRMKKVFIMGIFIMLSLTMFGLSTKAVNYTGLGNIDFEWDREIYDDTILRHTMSHDRSGEQKTYTLHYNPKTTKLRPVVTTGNGVYGGNTLSRLISQQEAQGNHVVFAINGDTYDVSNGVPSGLSINNGILLNSSNNKMGWGFTKDGDVQYGNARLPITFSIDGGSPTNILFINKERKLNTKDVYLMNEHFSDKTHSTQAGVEVILTVDEANHEGIRIGEPYKMIVDRVVTVQNNTSKNDTPIGKHKAVLATHTSSPHYNKLLNLQPGQEVIVNVDDNDDERIDWTQIETGLGIRQTLLENGVETSELSDRDIHPRTALGVKADGSVIFMQNDGRQQGWAQGMVYREMVEYMRDELGAIHVFNFDGGGSSTIAATLPGDQRATVLNSPSDGGERSNANAFILVSDDEPTQDKKIEKIHIYPSIPGNNATKGMILEGGRMSFYVTATDENYYPVPLTGDVTYRVEGDIGVISSAGNFTAKRGSGVGKIIASLGDIEAEFDLEVVNQISNIATERTIISVGPLGKTELEFKAYKDGVPIILTTDSLNFSVSPVDLGVVSPSGLFEAKKQSGTGELTVSYGEYSLKIPIEIGRLPIMIADFERDIFADNSWTKHFINIPGNGGSGDISINTNEDYVKHGDGSLRIDYDFKTKPLTGTVAIEISEHGGTVLEGQPKAIGAWVYGDGQGGWFRIQLTGGKYAGDTRINWTGWKYIETDIPTDAPFPFTVQKMVRLLGTPTIANNVAGTIYVDSVRVIYDYKNDDNNEPVVIADSISPKQGATTTDRQQVISLTVKDSPVEPVTGIDTSRTQLYVNNKLVDNIQQSVNPDGSVNITYNPGHLDRLRPGVQNVKVRVEDNFGNKKFIEWSFILEGYAVNLNEDMPDKDVIYAGEEFTYVVDTSSYKDFEQVELEVSYNSQSLELLELNIDDRLVVVEEQIDYLTGKVKYIIIGMNTLTKGDDPLFEFNFKAKETVDGTTAIKVDKAIITESSEEVEIILKGFDASMQYKYLINAFGSTFERETTILLTENQQPVSGVTLAALSNGNLVEFTTPLVTDSEGLIVTDFFTYHDIGTQFTLFFVKDGLVSNKTSIEILPSLGTHIPEKIVVTVGEDTSREVGISFQTNHEVEDAKVWISENEDLSNARVIETDRATVDTYHNNNDYEYTAWGAFVKELTPGTKYYYQVGSDLGKSDILSFTTLKESGDLDIAFYGDIQGAFDNFGRIQDRLNTMYPDIDLNLIAGDVADIAHRYNDWTQLDLHNKKYFNNGIWSSTLGNHDAIDDGKTFTRYFYGPLNGVENDIGARNYWFTAGDAIIFNFDTEAGFNSYDPGYRKQIALLTDVMNNTDKTFKIVNMHRSVYPLNYDEAGIRALAPTFEALGIDLVLSGHDHVYNRVTMANGVKQEGVHGGPTYIVGGTASGGKYYDGDVTRPWAGVAYNDNNPIFMIIKLRDGNRIEYEAYAVEGGKNVLIDEFVLEKNKVDVEEENFTYEGTRGFVSGGNVKFKITPDAGYYVDSVKVNGEVVNYDQDGYYIVENVSGNVTVTVELKEGINIYDVNGDGVVTEDDAKLILKYITGKETPPEGSYLLEAGTNRISLEFAREILEKLSKK